MISVMQLNLIHLSKARVYMCLYASARSKSHIRTVTQLAYLLYMVAILSSKNEKTAALIS